MGLAACARRVRVFVWAFWQSGISMKSHIQTRVGPKRAAQAIEHASRLAPSRDGVGRGTSGWAHDHAQRPWQAARHCRPGRFDERLSRPRAAEGRDQVAHLRCRRGARRREAQALLRGCGGSRRREREGRCQAGEGGPRRVWPKGQEVQQCVTSSANPAAGGIVRRATPAGLEPVGCARRLQARSGGD